MPGVLIEKAPFPFEAIGALELFKIDPGSAEHAGLERMIGKGLDLAAPKAAFLPARIEDRGEDWVVIGGEKFTSRVLAKNLESAHKAFPFLATCGIELEKWAGELKGRVEGMIARAVMGAALKGAMDAVVEAIRNGHHEGEVSRMTPGSLSDWPLAEQVPLFRLLGQSAEAAGVTLKDDLFMTPVMSVSGLWFPTDESFESCMLCPMEDCPGRRAPYDDTLFKRKYSR